MVNSNSDQNFPKHIYDLYNDALSKDQPFVDSIVAAIKAEIVTNINAEINHFMYDTDALLGAQPFDQRIRVTDLVIRYFRERGIRCFLGSYPYYNYNNFNLNTTLEGEGVSFSKLTIEINIRRGSEYMKSYFN